MATIPELSVALFPFQWDIVAWALRRGRAALFAGTGLGKTLMQLSWADAVERHTGRPVLILTPLAVAQQTVQEAARFGIHGVAYARSQDDAASRIVVTNYDRFDLFDIEAFGAIVLDESSIIKAHASKTRATLIEACRTIPFKLACTATPAPNDWVELGNHAEFLGVCSEKEMLATYFVHDGSVRAHGDSEWRLKSHATKAFWEWVASWAVMIRSPADLGYDESRYELPPLRKHQVTVPADYVPTSTSLFPIEAHTMQERIAARRDTVRARAEAAARIVNAQPDRPWLVWCNLNAEADALAELIPDAVEVRGPDAPEVKAERLLGFAAGKYRILITKPSVAGWGMNWQHCADMVFVGLTDSFEQVFQAIRRCWRFGQAQPVNVYMIASEIEGAVVANLDAKERAFEQMSAAMALEMRDLNKRALNPTFARPEPTRFTKPMEIPAWLAA
nr:DEAD/DEAH box helicase [Enterovirga sp. DB1703]